MSTKRKLIEQANRRLLNEDVPPPITFTEHETLKMMCELIDYDLGGKPEMPEKLIEIFQDGLRKKGRYIPENPEPDPPGMMR